MPDIHHACAPQLTEREVLAAARSIRELQALRDLRDDGTIRTGQLKLPHGTIPLETDEVTAVLGLLIERHTVLVASLGICPDQPAT